MLCLGQSGYYDFTVVTNFCPIFKWSFCTFASWNLWIYFEETCRRGKQHLSSSISPRGQASIDELDPRNAEILAQFKVTIERISSWIERLGMYCMMFFCHSKCWEKVLLSAGLGHPTFWRCSSSIWGQRVPWVDKIVGASDVAETLRLKGHESNHNVASFRLQKWWWNDESCTYHHQLIHLPSCPRQGNNKHHQLDEMHPKSERLIFLGRDKVPWLSAIGWKECIDASPRIACTVGSFNSGPCCCFARRSIQIRPASSPVPSFQRPWRSLSSRNPASSNLDLLAWLNLQNKNYSEDNFGLADVFRWTWGRESQEWRVGSWPFLSIGSWTKALQPFWQGWWRQDRRWVQNQRLKSWQGISHFTWNCHTSMLRSLKMCCSWRIGTLCLFWWYHRTTRQGPCWVSIYRRIRVKRRKQIS